MSHCGQVQPFFSRICSEENPTPTTTHERNLSSPTMLERAAHAESGLRASASYCSANYIQKVADAEFDLFTFTEDEFDIVSDEDVCDVGEDDSDPGEQEEEEKNITILKSILYYYSNSGIFPTADSAELHDFIRNSIRVDLPRVRVQNMILMLEKRFNKIAQELGDDAQFKRPFDQEMFALSKRIWDRQYKMIDPN